jgi:hypothetical protein
VSVEAWQLDGDFVYINSRAWARGSLLLRPRISSSTVQRIRVGSTSSGGSIRMFFGGPVANDGSRFAIPYQVGGAERVLTGRLEDNGAVWIENLEGGRAR